MPDWFLQNAPAQGNTNDWFSANAPAPNPDRSFPSGYAPPAGLPQAGAKPRIEELEGLSPEEAAQPVFTPVSKYRNVTRGDISADQTVAGAREAAAGLAQMSRPLEPQSDRSSMPNLDEKLGGLSRVVRGTGQAVAPFAAPLAFAAAPIPAAVAMVAGGAAQLGTEKGLSALGAPPGASALAGDVAGLAAGAGGAKIPGAISRAFTADPAIAMVRALRPAPSDSGFIKRLPDTLAHIKSSAGADITSNEALIPAAKAAIENHQNALGAWMTRARTMGATAPGDAIADASVRALPYTMILESPETAQGIAQRANDAYRGKQFTVDQLRRLLKEKNAELDSFYSKAEGKQAAAVTSGAPQAVVKAQRDAIADTLYKALDPEMEGARPRQIQQQTGDMIAIQDAALRRRNAIIAEKPISTAEKIGRGAAKYASLPARVVTGKPFGQAGLPFGATGEAEIAAGTSDPLIRKAFAAVGEPGEIPMPDAPWQGTPRQLGASTRMPAAPDTSFVRGESAEPPYRTRQIAAPEVGQPPVNVLPRGPAGTAWRMPPAGSNAAFGGPGRLLGLPAPPLKPGNVVVRLTPESGAPLPAENTMMIPRPPEFARGGIVAPKHGGSVEDRVRGSADVPLSGDGHIEADNLGRLFSQKGFGQRGDTIQSGNLTRAKQTAAAIHKYSPEAKSLPPNGNLDTWALGALEGQPTEQVADIIKDLVEKHPDDLPPRGGPGTLSPESFNTFKARFLRHLKQDMIDFLRNPNTRRVRVTHGRGVRLTRGWIAKGMPDDFSVDNSIMLRDDDKPGDVHRFAPGKKGKWQITEMDMNKVKHARNGIFEVRHAATPWNRQDPPKAIKPTPSQEVMANGLRPLQRLS